MSAFSSSSATAARRAIRWRGMRLELLPAPALHFPKARALIVADLHLGKDARFRSAGVPVPDGGTQRDLDRLSRALESCGRPRGGGGGGPRRLIILGDLFHARAGCDARLFEALRAWRHAHPQLEEMILVRGNHDRQAGDPPSDLAITCVDEPFIDDGLAFRHFPAEKGSDPFSEERCQTPLSEGSGRGGGSRRDAKLPSVAGHVHPCAVLHDVHGSSLRVPCFLFGREAALLPAFGSFTGMHPVRPRRGERVFAVGNDEVIEVKNEE